MASEQGMSGIDTRAVAFELSAQLPLWIDKVYQFDSHLLGIRLNGENRAKFQLVIEAGRRAHLVGSLPEPPKNPPQFAMFLRKYIAGGKVLAIRQHGLERILILDIGKGESGYRLIVELFDDGNVILTDEKYRILRPLRHHRFKDRDIVPGATYTLSSDIPTASYENFSTALKNESRDLVRALAIGCMLGGTYAEYLCRTAGLNKAMPAAEADPAPLWAALRELLDRVERDRRPVIMGTRCEPVDLIGGDGVRYPTFSEALAAFYPLSTAAQKGKGDRQVLSKEERIARYRKNAIKKFDEKIEKAQQLVDAIYGNYEFLSRLIASLDVASRRLPWQEIEKHLRDTRTADAKKIIGFFPAEAAVDVDVGKVVRLHVRESLEENAGRYHDQIKKFRKKKEGALAAMAAAPVRKAAGPRREIVPIKKLWYHRFRWFITSDGTIVLGGRDASQNEELVRKYMAGTDLFVHADVHGASVVIVKGTTGRMDEVAQFAASYSGAWKSGHFSADVFAALPSQVSKTPQPGEYVARGAFIVRGERTWYRNVPLAVGIGLMLEPGAAVIGGPPSAVREKTVAYSGLVPGRFEPNDVAKKVLRALREKIPEADQKGLKGILNTETVAAFVPPGGSDILAEGA